MTIYICFSSFETCVACYISSSPVAHYSWIQICISCHKGDGIVHCLSLLLVGIVANLEKLMVNRFWK